MHPGSDARGTYFHDGVFDSTQESHYSVQYFLISTEEIVCFFHRIDIAAVAKCVVSINEILLVDNNYSFNGQE
jgi:hypothetical protein